MKFKIVSINLVTGREEVIDETDDMKNAEFLQVEYQMAVGRILFEIVIRTSEEI